MGYTIQQKIDICLRAETSPDMTQADLALWAHHQYRTTKPPSQTTISRILSSKALLVSLKKHELTHIRRRKPTNSVLRHVLQEWISQCIWDGIPVSIPLMQHAAHDFWYRLPDELRLGTGDFNSKWCHQFLLKVNITLSTLDHHALTTSQHKIWTFEEREALQEELGLYSAKDIFCIDELQLCYNLPLDKAYYTELPSFPPEVAAIPHVTLMFGINADGSERLEPLVIGSCERAGRAPSAPGGGSPPGITTARHFERSGITYRSNRKAWLTSTIFYDYLLVLDKRLAVAQRTIVILIDDCSAHKIINVNLLRIKLIVTNAGGNAHLGKSFLPFSWGLVEEFKALYRLQQYLHVINLQREKSAAQRRPVALTAKEYQLQLHDCAVWIRQAWEAIPTATVLACWRYAHVLPEHHLASHSPRRHSRAHSLPRRSLETLRTLISQLNVTETWDVHALLDLPTERKNKMYISNLELIDACIVDEFAPEGVAIPEFDREEAIGAGGLGPREESPMPLLLGIPLCDMLSPHPSASYFGAFPFKDGLKGLGASFLDLLSQRALWEPEELPKNVAPAAMIDPALQRFLLFADSDDIYNQPYALTASLGEEQLRQTDRGISPSLLFGVSLDVPLEDVPLVSPPALLAVSLEAPLDVSLKAPLEVSLQPQFYHARESGLPPESLALVEKIALLERVLRHAGEFTLTPQTVRELQAALARSTGDTLRDGKLHERDYS